MEKRVLAYPLFAAFLIAAALLCLAPGVALANETAPGLAPASGVALADEAAPELHNPTINSDGITTWDCVYFGRYPQSKDSDGNFVVEPIKWRVLAVNGNDAFLLSDKNIDSVPYNVMEPKGFYCYWHNCTLRSWLNGFDASVNKSRVDYTNDNFIDRAFTPEEQEAIILTEVENNKPIEWGHNPEDTIFVTTYDKVYLLHYYDALDSRYGFSESDEPAINRVVLNTAYTASGGTCKSILMQPENEKNSWVLRSPGEYSMYCDFITAEGEYDDILVDGNLITATDHGVRPVIHLDLTKTELYSYAGTFSALYDQKITVSSQFSKKLGDSAFNLNAKTDGNGSLTYSSDDESVAEVDTSGVVTLKGVGTAHILVTASQTDKYFGTSKEVTVKVSRAAQEITVESTFSKKLGDAPFNLNATTSGNGALSYASDNESVATVDASGLVTLKGVGTARILVMASQTDTWLEASKEVVVKVEATDIAKAKVTLAKASGVYNGKTQKGTVKSVTLNGKTLKSSDYKVSAKSGTKVGSYQVTVTGQGAYKGTAKATYKIVKASQAITVKGLSKSFTVKALKSAAKKFKITASAKTSVTYKVTKKNAQLTFKNGQVTVKKGTKKGTYKISVKISAAANANYKAATKNATITVKVK